MFHITVGVSPRSRKGVDLSQDVELLKAAVLYGDEVTLCSPASSLMTQLLLLAQLGEQATDREKAELFEQVFGDVIDYRSESPEHATQIRTVIQQYKTLLVKNRLPKKLLLLRERLRGRFRSTWKQLSSTILKLGDDAGLSDVLLAVESGIVKLHLFQTESPDPESFQDETIQEFLEIVNQAVVGNESYPLLDDFTGGIVKAQIKEGRLTVTEPHVGRAKHVGLASSLFERLPLFDRASLKQVLQIRGELDKPLSRFRGAVLSFSETIVSAPWDGDFPAESEALFLKDVQPAVLDIEESIRNNSFLIALCSRISDKPQVLAPPALAVGLSQTAWMPEIATLSLGLGAAALTALDVAAGWKREKSANENNQLFFYYKTGKILSKGT